MRKFSLHSWLVQFFSFSGRGEGRFLFSALFPIRSRYDLMRPPKSPSCFTKRFPIAPQDIPYGLPKVQFPCQVSLVDTVVTNLQSKLSFPIHSRSPQASTELPKRNSHMNNEQNTSNNYQWNSCVWEFHTIERLIVQQTWKPPNLTRFLEPWLLAKA